MNHTEHNLQAACITWFRMQYPTRSGLLFAIPNGAKLAGTPWQRAQTLAAIDLEADDPRKGRYISAELLEGRARVLAQKIAVWCKVLGREMPDSI